MASAPCPFCEHSNTVGAKFCNDCGTPLHPEPCSQCGAVSHRASKHCTRCGAELPAPPATREPTPEWIGIDPAGAVLPSSEFSFVSPPLALPESAQQHLDALPRPMGHEIAGSQDRRAKSLEIDPRSPVGQLTPHSSETQDTARMGPLPEVAPPAASYRKPRAALYTVMLVAAVVLGYYAYFEPTQLKQWLVAPPRDSDVPVINDSSRVPSPTSPAKIRAAPSSPSSDPDAGAGSVTSAGSTAVTVGAESADKVIASPRARNPAAFRSDRDTDEISTSPVARSALPEGASLKGGISADAAPEATRSDAARLKAPQTQPSRAVPRSAAGVEATWDRPRATAGRADTPSETPRVSVCTEGVAALGFCSLRTQRENN